MQRIFLSIFLASIIFFSIFSPAQAEQSGSVVLVVTDRMSIYDINEELTGFTKIINEGAVGLLNNNTGGRITPENAFVTIGAGAHALGNSYGHMAFQEDIKLENGLAAQIYRQRTGMTPPPESIVHLGLARLIQANSTLPRTIEVGALGKALHEAGYKTAVFGNTDYDKDLGRLAVCIAMDNNGIVDYGKIDHEILHTDHNFPGGTHTDYQALWQEVSDALGKYQLIVVHLGDLERLYKQRNDIFSTLYQHYYQQELKNIDNFLQKLTAVMGKRDLLMVFSPTQDQLQVEEKKLLTPILMWSKEGGPQGLLISGTTKHPGIVMSTDIAATVLSHFDVSYDSTITGRGMYAVPFDEDKLSYLQQKQNELAVTYNARAPLQQTYVFLQIVLLAVSLWLIFVYKKGTKILKPAILFVVSVPLAYLLIPLLPGSSVVVVGMELFLVASFLATLAHFIGRNNFMKSFGLLAAGTAIMILIDTALGQPLQKQAILSYDPMVGARFYGIGNEYMGVLIGSTIMAVSLMVSHVNKKRPKLAIFATALIFGITIFSLAAPHLGTNVGGTIAATVAFLTTFLLFINIKFRPKTILIVAGAVLLLLLSFIAFDLTRPIQQQSHIGQTARLIMDGGWIEIYNIINRKLAMNMKLLRYTVWSRVLLASIVVLAILFYKPRGLMKTISNEYPIIFKGFIGLVTGALFAFAFNDSGVVAAATTMIFGAPPLIYLVLNEQIKRGM